MVSLDPNHQPCCADGETLAATPIICGPNGLHFDKQVLLSHKIIQNEHCNYAPVICHDDEKATCYDYTILDESDHETRCFINGNQAYWFTSHFTGFAVKASDSQSVGVQIYPFLEEFDDNDDDAVLRIRYFDCLEGKQQVVCIFKSC